MIKRIFFIATLLLLANAGIYAQATGSSVVRGVLKVKLSANDGKRVQGLRALKASAGSSLTVGIAKLDAANRKYGVTEMTRVFPDAGIYEAKHRKYGLHLWYMMDISDNVDPAAVAADYKKEGLVEQAEPVYAIKRIKSLSDGAAVSVVPMALPPNTVPNDPSIARQWSYNNTGAISGSLAGADIRLFEAWSISTGKQNVIVSVVDGGIDRVHEDIAASMWVNQAELNGTAGVDDDHNNFIDDIYGYNFVNGNGIITSDSHGTHVAGTVAAVTNNAKGVAGVAGGDGSGNGIRLMSCQIFEGNRETFTLPRAIIYGADNGAVISQNSWGYNDADVYNAADLAAIRYFINEAGRDANGNPRPNTPMVGGIVIFAAGNDGDSQKWYPGAFDEVTAVAAIGPNGKKPSYSNYADWVDITAPGGMAGFQTAIYSTFPGNNYGYDYGTSMACPHVSGVAALILSRYGSATFTPDSLRNRIMLTATSIAAWEPTYAKQMGVGLVNATAALKMVPVRGLSLNIDNARLFENEELQLVAQILPSNATDKKLTWESSNASYVTVDANGKVRAIAAESENKYSEAIVTATTEDGKYNASCRVLVYENMILPDGFSPNNDGHNDYFTLNPFRSGDIYMLNVFDRSGQLCYQNADYKNDWNGIANTGSNRGSKILPGTYYYTVTLKSSGMKKRGSLVIRY